MVKIYIDPGHGGYDSGATFYGLQEKNVTLQISKKIHTYLKRYGKVDVKMSRTTDEFISLATRTNEANSWNADCFLSIHINAGGGTGFESYIYKELSNESQTNHNRHIIHQEVANVIELKNRGEKKANFHVLRESNMPAMLGENGFIDTREDAMKMKDAAWIDRVGKAYAEGIAKAFSLKGNSSPNHSNSHKSPGGTKVEPTGKIASIQKSLNKRYHFSIAVDNLYGPETKRSLLKAYQRELNRQFNGHLKIDGLWGPKTSAASVEVQIGAKGQLTWILQALLIIKGHHLVLDGIFGKKTQQTVKSFQHRKGLHVDGIAGRKTYHALFG